MACVTYMAYVTRMTCVTYMTYTYNIYDLRKSY